MARHRADEHFLALDLRSLQRADVAEVDEIGRRDAALASAGRW
jgi:hypothetical protein